MSAAAPSIAGIKAAGPATAAAALVIAGGAYLLPLPGLSPPAWSGPQPKELAEGPASTRPKGPPPGLVMEPKDWVTLAPLFAQLREPVTTAQIPAGAEPGGGAEPPKPPDPVSAPIPWHYRGFIREPSRLVALVELPEGQRLLAEGETVPDSSSHGESIEVLRIEPEHLVIRRAGGKEETLKVETSTPDSEVNRRTLTPRPPLGRR